MYPSPSGSKVLSTIPSPTLCSSATSSSYRYGQKDNRRLDLCNSDLWVMLLLPEIFDLPGVDNDRVVTSAADEPITDVNPSASSPHELHMRDVRTRRPPGFSSRDIAANAAKRPDMA